MDGACFDDLTRSAAGRTRRDLIKGLAGALAAGLIGGRASEAAAATCRDAGSTCTKAAHCCSGVCSGKDRTGRRRCDCPKGYKICRGQCVPPDACCIDTECAGLTTGCVIGVCDRGTGTCRTAPARAGTTCNSGFLCSAKDACDGQGNCRATEKDCSHVEDDCNTSFCIAETGQCARAPINDNGTCTSSNLCATKSICQGGTCKDVEFKDCSVTEDCKSGACVAGQCQVQNADPGDSCSADLCYVGTCQADGTCNRELATTGSSCGDNGEHCCRGECLNRFTVCPV